MATPIRSGQVNPQRELTGETGLLTAILIRAFLDLERHEPEARDADGWVHSPDMSPFSYHWVCQHLGIEGSKLREEIAGKRAGIDIAR